MKDAQREAHRQTLLAALLQLSLYAQDQLSMGLVSPKLTGTIARVVGEIEELAPAGRIELVRQLGDTFTSAVFSLEEMDAVLNQPITRPQEDVMADAEAPRSRAWTRLLAAHELIKPLIVAEGKPIVLARR